MSDKPAIALVNKDGFTATALGLIRYQCPPYMPIDEAKAFFNNEEQANDTPN
jgi:hypothetical protein